jgi:hypothetical protein
MGRNWVGTTVESENVCKDKKEVPNRRYEKNDFEKLQE